MKTIHGYHVLLGAAVGFAGPVVEHDGLPQRPWGVADRGALDAGEDFGAEPGVERAFEHGGTGLTGVTLVTGGAEARQALLMQGLVVLVGFAGVIAQVVAMLGGGGLNDAGEDLIERLRVLAAVPSGICPDVGEIGLGMSRRTCMVSRW